MTSGMVQVLLVWNGGNFYVEVFSKKFQEYLLNLVSSQGLGEHSQVPNQTSIDDETSSSKLKGLDIENSGQLKC